MKHLVSRLKLFATFRYTDPSLHPGQWGPPELRRGVITWRRTDEGWLRPYTHAHVHQAFICVIGPGMAHVDTCLCGSERYGVFGSWS